MTEYNLKYVYDDSGRGEIRQWIKDYSRDNPLQVLTVNNATILPKRPSSKTEPYSWMGIGGVVDEDGAFIPLSGIKHILHDAYVFGGKYRYDADLVEYIDEDIIYIGPMFNHWGHFLYEFVTRLWYCYKNETLRIAYCGWGFDEGILYGSYKRFFELTGIDPNKLIDIRKPTKFKRVIIPEQCYLRNQYALPEYKEMMERAYDNIVCEGLKPFKKIYFTRASFVKNKAWFRECGEEVIQKTFERNGYKVFDPAELSLDEQIFYMHNCDVVAVIGSSTGADTVFMREGTDRIYIRKGFYMDNDLPQIDYITRANKVTIIDCWLRPYKSFKAGHSSGPNLIGSTDIFMEYLRDNGMQPLKSSEYNKNKIRVYIWFVGVGIYNKLFDVLYPIYYKTIRKIIRKNQGG